MRTRLINLVTLRPNPRAGQFVWPVPGKTRTWTEEDGRIISRREVTFVRSMYPSPPYLFEYEPMTAKCVHCGAVSSVDDFDDDYYFDGFDEYPMSDICPACKREDAVGEQIQYETVEEALKRKEKL